MRKRKEWKPTETARIVFQALQSLRGEAFNEEVARRLGGWNPNGVSVSLGRLCERGYVENVEKNRNNPRWKIKKDLPR